jgi:hypothetical protein
MYYEVPRYVALLQRTGRWDADVSCMEHPVGQTVAAFGHRSKERHRNS